MSAYAPIYIRGNTTGLILNRQQFILPDDANPVLENALVYREQLKRKQGTQFLGRLRRQFTNVSIGNSSASTWTIPSIYALLPIPPPNQPNAQIEPGSVLITIASSPTIIYTDNGDGTFSGNHAGLLNSTINYATGTIVLKSIFTPIGGFVTTLTMNYFPGLPVMGICYRDNRAINSSTTVFFDTYYAYNLTSTGFVEFIQGETWSGNLPTANLNFFWSTNYWIDSPTTGFKLFWVTNNSGTLGDPIRYTNGEGNNTGTWNDFGASSTPPQTGLINAGGVYLNQCLCLLPFRSRLLAFNTLEGTTLATSNNFSNRIRWSAIGNPLVTDSVGPPVVNGAWRDDIRGQGGFLDIPTSENIVSVGIVRDNLIIYCDSSTWQLRYTGRSISPFQIERVNSELGSSSTFSSVQFDTSLVAIGDKGVVECDSYQSRRIDIKIPDLVMKNINNANNGQIRVQGIRNFLNRLAFWIYPDTSTGATYPDRRLVYNYENDSWAIFTDSLTTLGNFLPISSRTWANPSGTTSATKVTWAEANFPWNDHPQGSPVIIGGNQQGFISYLDTQSTNDASLYISSITAVTNSPTQITSPSHNLQSGQIIQINGIIGGSPFASALNGNNYQVSVQTGDTFFLLSFNSTTQDFTDSVDLPPPGGSLAYIGGGVISVLDNFRIVTKKFNFLEEGQNIQIGHIDLLMDTTESGAISMNMYSDYDDDAPVNTPPNNFDSFFNAIIDTTPDAQGTSSNTKINQKVFCNCSSNYLNIEYTLSPAQMNGPEQASDVAIDMQIVWARPSGRIGPL